MTEKNNSGKIVKRKRGRPKGSRNKAKADLMAIAQKYTAEAIEGLAEIARTSESAAARVQAWNALLDRGHGKAPQAYEGRIEGELKITWQK